MDNSSKKTKKGDYTEELWEKELSELGYRNIVRLNSAKAGTKFDNFSPVDITAEDPETGETIKFNIKSQQPNYKRWKINESCLSINKKALKALEKCDKLVYILDPNERYESKFGPVPYDRMILVVPVNKLRYGDEYKVTYKIGNKEKTDIMVDIIFASTDIEYERKLEDHELVHLGGFYSGKPNWPDIRKSVSRVEAPF
jgi:hypothetical protein